MDWFSWLSTTHLDPPFIHEYAATFSHNQLDQDDISYFNHEFLQSMGISIAKHRLEILKLAKKSSSGSNPIARLIATIKRTKSRVTRCVRTWVHRNDSAMVLVKKRSYSSRWKGVLVKRSNRLMMNQKGSSTLLITNGNRPVVRTGGAKVNSFSGSLTYDLRHDERKEDDGDQYIENLYSDDDADRFGGGYDSAAGGEYWSGRGVEEIKWDAMFQNLKPT